MATDHNFRVKNGLEVGGQEVISSSGVITSAALGGQTLGTTDSPTFANATLTGSLRGPSTFTIDPAAVGDNTGTLVIAGNLQVDGTTTTINSTTMEVDDLNITLASGSANAAAANGAGITVDIANNTNATLLYNGSIDRWDFNKALDVTGYVQTDTAFRAYDSDNTAYRNVLRYDSGDVRLETGTGSSASNLGIWTGGGRRISVLSNGYVGINKDTPLAQLHVYSVPAEGFRLEGNDEYVYNSYYGTVSSSLTRLGYIGFANQTGTATDFNFVNDQSGRFTFDTLSATRFQIEGGTVRSNEKLLINADAGNEQFVIRRSSATNEQLILGVHSSDYATIQAVEQGVSWNPIALNPNGGNIGIGTVAPQSELAINFGSGRNTSPPTTNIHQSNFSVLKNDGTTGGDYGYQLGVKNSGDVWSQVGRTDNSGTSTWYHQIMQPSGGNVVIGRDGTPVAKLEVSGQLFAGPIGAFNATTKAEMSTYNVLKLKPHDGNSTNMTFASVSGGDAIGIQVSNGPQTANWHIALNPFGGYVGIGTDSPAVELDIKRSANSYPLRIGSSQGEGRAMVFADVHASPNKYNWLVGSQYNINNAFEITPSTAVGGYTFTDPGLSISEAGIVKVKRLHTTSTTAIEFLGNSNTGTYNRTALYTNQNNSGSNFNNGIHLEMGRISDSSSAEVRAFVVGARGGQSSFKVLSDQAGVTQSDGDYVAKLHNTGADGYLSLYIGTGTPTLKTKISSYGTSFFNSTTGQTAANQALVSIGAEAGAKAGYLNINSAATSTSGGIRHRMSQGTQYLNVASTHTGSGSLPYWHIKTSIYYNQNVMFVARVHGYAYGNAGHIIDMQRSGYAYSGSSTSLVGSQFVNNGSYSSAALDCYYAAGQLCFRAYGGASSYYTGWAFDIKMQSPTGYNHDFVVVEHNMNATSGNYYT